MRSAIMSGAMEIPVDYFTPKELRRIKAQLTYTYEPMGEKPVKIKGYRVDGDSLFAPRQFGVKLCNQLQIPWEDHTSSGRKVKFPKVPTPRAYQVEPLQQILSSFDDYHDTVFKAHTGWGKTIGSLYVAAQLGVSTLIIVDQDNLKDQWLETLTNPDLFGFKEKDIGIIQGPTCDYKGKAVTIAMVQTLTQKEFPPDMYDAFGLVILDEVHTLGAPTFSQALLQFNATFRLGVSATPKRKDGLQKALDNSLGRVRVAAEKKHEESAVYILRHPTVYSFYGNISPKVGRIVSEVAEDARRNMMLAEVILGLYDTGRDVLVMGDRIEHLKNMESLLLYMGIEEQEIGLYTGYEPVWVFGKLAETEKHPAHLHRWKNVKGETKFAQYSAVGMQVKNRKIPAATLKHRKETCRIILATFGKFSKGVDEPRLSAGVDLTPRSAAEQSQGRILRTRDGKKKPIWVTTVDVSNYRLVRAFSGRIKEYEQSNAKLYEWDGDEETTLCDPKKLYKESLAESTRLQETMKIVPVPRSSRFVLQSAGAVRQTMAEETRARFKAAARKGSSKLEAGKRKSAPSRSSGRE